MTTCLSNDQHLKARLQQVLSTQNLQSHTHLLQSVAAELGLDMVDCAAALLFLVQQVTNTAQTAFAEPDRTQEPAQHFIKPLEFKKIRYRLNIGKQHQISHELLKKVLIEESGVDKSNIQNINMQNLYTLIDLPDEMPQDIFLHLKSVEINQQKLDIKRVKLRNNKKRGHNAAKRKNAPPTHEINA